MKTTKSRSTSNIFLSGTPSVGPSSAVTPSMDPLSSVEPPIPANTCCGMLMRGNNGQVFKSTKNPDGKCSWKKT